MPLYTLSNMVEQGLTGGSKDKRYLNNILNNSVNDSPNVQNNKATIEAKIYNAISKLDDLSI